MSPRSSDTAQCPACGLLKTQKGLLRHMLARPYCKSWLERDSSHRNNHDNEPWDGDAGENAGVGDGHGDEVEDESRTSYLNTYTEYFSGPDQGNSLASLDQTEGVSPLGIVLIQTGWSCNAISRILNTMI